MSQIDSPSSLRSKDRAQYYKEQQRLKEQYNKDLDSQKNRFDKINEQRNEKLQKDVGEVRDRYEKKFDELKNQSSSETKKYQDKIQKQITKEQDQNIKTLAEQREDFQRRVEDLNVEYKNQLDAEQKRNLTAEEMQKSKFKNNLQNKEESFVNYNDDVRSKQDQITEEMYKNSKFEKNKLEQKYTNILQDQTASEIKKRQVEKNASKEVLDKTQLDNKIALKLKDIERDALVSDMRKENNQILEKRIADEKVNHDKILAGHNREIEKERGVHRRELNQTHMDNLMEKRIRDYQDGRKAESLQRSMNNGISVTPKEKQQEDEIRRWKDRNRAMDEKLGSQQEQYVDNLKQLQQKNKIEAGSALQKKDVESDNRVMDVLAAERLKYDKSQSTWESKQIADKEIFDRSTRQSEKTLKDRVTNLNETYTQRLQDLNDKNSNMLIGLKREHLHDKREFAINIETQFNKRQLELVRDFEKKQDLLMSEYEKKIGFLENQNIELITSMHETINKVRRDENQKMINQQDMLIEQKKDNERSLHEMMARREKELRQTIYKLHEDYTAQINNQENNFKNRMTELASTYEQKLFVFQRDTNKELNSKSNEMVRERKALHVAFEDEKKRLSEQYENVIRNMKSAHQEYIVNLNKFKKANEKMTA